MISPSDKSYQETKLIKQGKAVINPDFVPLAAWIDKTYNVQTMNIIYDVVAYDKQPRLEIVFENGWDVVKFRQAGGSIHQTAILRVFEAEVNSAGKYRTENMFVIFDSFASIAIEEAHGHISTFQLEQLQDALRIEALWKISGSDGGAIVTFFFYTDQQVQENMGNGVKEMLADRYFQLLKSHDEFNYIKRENFNVSLDSKENLDKNYSGSLLYYYRH
ncbi:hypothetical protein [Chitinophaga filiformis]|uniref:Uncharacterized protein n=1 Tax=Chitinophaga filiformis TaxID=104663 RepID=A0A1G7PCU8_CHIFI|nr:hypothetical protein [Chitinophaga filiformis]SDF84054.1 hypothetical protein SAMN04488121_1021145 [Chitinophaga filiformis]